MLPLRILTHAGSGTPRSEIDGTQQAARAALAAAEGASPLDEIVLAAMDALEDDPRFNAGTGSSLRADKKTVQMDAAFMAWRPGRDEDAPEFGAVACIERVRHPARVAAALARNGAGVLCGPGATRFARERNHCDHDPVTEGARRRLAESLPASDTVGCVVSDGRSYAAALSSGGLTGCRLGRVGDVPLPGCGLYAGPKGAVAFTGIGEEILRRSAALRAYRRLAEGVSASEVLKEVHGWFGDIEFGCILLGPDSHAGGSNRDMAWSFLERLNPESAAK